MCNFGLHLCKFSPEIDTSSPRVIFEHQAASNGGILPPRSFKTLGLHGRRDNLAGRNSNFEFRDVPVEQDQMRGRRSNFYAACACFSSTDSIID
jgi:hypothetical protein